MKFKKGSLLRGDCLAILPTLPAGSVDMVFADLPYGITACKWDTPIDLQKLWEHLGRACKDDAGLVFTASQPFTSALIMSNPRWFKVEWVWKRNTGSNPAVGKYQPLRYHESVVVFSPNGNRTRYFPQPTARFSQRSVEACKRPIKGGGKKTSKHYGMDEVWVQYDPNNKLPESVVEFKSVPNAGGKKLHSTQKPVDLVEYFINTYSNPGDTILDPTCGSGTTAIAAINTGRRFLCIENDVETFMKAAKRICQHEGTS